MASASADQQIVSIQYWAVSGHCVNSVCVPFTSVELEMRSNDSQKIIVVGIPKTMDDAQLSELFGDFGAVAEAKVVLDAASGESRGFGFVTFTAGSAMRAAIKAMNKKVVQGRTLNVRQLVPKDQFQAQKKEEPDAAQRPCWLLRKGKCTKGANCPFSHDVAAGESFGSCFEFVQTGSCKRGDKCKFVHPKKDDEETEDEGNEKTEKKEKKVQESDTKPEKRVCYSFQNGRCHRGKKCLYAHELLANASADSAPKGKKKADKVDKQPFEVVTEHSEAGKKRRRPEQDDDQTESEEEVTHAKEKKAKKAPAAAGLAAHVNNFMNNQKPVVKQQIPKKPQQKQHNGGLKKFEWKAKTLTGQKQEREKDQEQEREGEKQPHPIKKMKTEKIDMGAAFDGVSDDEASRSRGGKKGKVDKEKMRANREKLKMERRAKRSAKKTALSKLLAKGEVELGA
ncbi:unnamed protein product [Phytophthora fragariaefolia]|uniref:Unnamed protein product n=1 Tax=Phytophthora fragariaefolia TaxID=1490495 RepID=A0A9W6YKR2_9STRA|nr:unnamed protein product [Phytophthora fragariaefolia]